MKQLMMGCAVIAMVALSARSEARPSDCMAFTISPAVQAVHAKRSLGVASWYGEDCEGNLTASGEVFDMNQLTAANRDLPLGTKIQVTNLHNHRSVVLRVNDRGPFVPGRMLDVSKTAAEHLGFIGAGLARVELKVLRYPQWYARCQTQSGSN
jgi:peptidoglycan lytic transglycosylase